MKIAHVLLSRGFAGSERSTAESCNEQCKNHEVLLVLRSGNRKKGASVRDHLDPRVQVVEIPSKLFSTWSLKRALQKFRPDVVHCHLRRSTRLVAKANPDCAKVSTLHISYNGKYFRYMEGLVCNARWQVEAIPAEYKGEVFKANNSLSTHPKLTQDKIQELRTGLGVAPDEYLIAAVGRYSVSKGWDTLIEAFIQVPVAVGEAKLVFFGSGSLEPKLKEQAAGDKSISFAGYKSDIKDYYQCADLLVCPSRFEPLPRTILEGMDAGVPVLASDAGGCLELIQDYGGFSFPVNDVTALREKLIYCIKTKPPRTEIDLSAHHVENANRAMEEFYGRLIHNYRSGK